MTTQDPDPFGVSGVSYATRAARAESRRAWSDRVIGTGTLFGIAMSLSFLLGRRR